MNKEEYDMFFELNRHDKEEVLKLIKLKNEYKEQVDLSYISSVIKEKDKLKYHLEVSEQKRCNAVKYIKRFADKGYNFGSVLQGDEIARLLEILEGE